MDTAVYGRKEGWVVPFTSASCSFGGFLPEPYRDARSDVAITLVLTYQDKLRKIMDIWTKGGTFPPACLERLAAKIGQAEASSSSNIGELDNSDLAPMMSPALPPLDFKDEGEYWFLFSLDTCGLAFLVRLPRNKSGCADSRRLADMPKTISAANPRTSVGYPPFALHQKARPRRIHVTY